MPVLLSHLNNNSINTPMTTKDLIAFIIGLAVIDFSFLLSIRLNERVDKLLIKG